MQDASEDFVIDLIDTHCHIDFVDFDHDRRQIIARANSHGVNRIVVPGVSAASWPKTIDTCKVYQPCLLALGLHPVFIEQHQPQHLTELDALITQHRPIAVGEIGLDFFLRELDREKQIAFFTKQLIIAKQHDLPVIIHNRKAHDECLQILRKHRVRGGIVHAFNGSQQQAGKYIELGFCLGFGGMLTYERSSKLHKLVETLPEGCIVLETDAPDMTVEQFKGERNSPEYIPHIVKSMASIRSSTEHTIAQTTTLNALRCLGLPPS